VGKKISKVSSPRIRVEFSGGEPLLRYSLIFRTIEEAISIFTHSNKKFDFHIQTNGTVLNSEIIDFLKKYPKISLGISADGPPEIHNRNRVFPDGGGSFDIVMKNMKRLREAGIKFGILSVVEKTDEVEKIYDFWVSEGYSYFRLNPVFLGGRSKRIFSENEQKEFAYAELEVFRKSLKDCVTLTNIYYLLQNIILYERPYMCLRSPCGAGVSQICINWDGDIYPCQEFISSSNFVIGNILKCEDIEQLLSNSPIVKSLKNRIVENIDECKECVWKKFCGNPCAAKTYFFYGDYMKKNPFCTYYKTIFKELIWEIFFQKDKILEIYFKRYYKR
jgi:radical SAM protein with 4Fe4S-binding SPASM domain